MSHARCLVILLLGALIGLPVASVAGESDKVEAPEVQALRQRITRLQEQRQALLERVEQLTRTVEQQQALIEKLQAKADGPTGEASADAGRGESSDSRIAALEAQVAQLKAQKQAMAEQTREDRSRRMRIHLSRYKDDQTGRAMLATRPRQLKITHGSRAEHWLWLEAPAPQAGHATPDAIAVQLQTAFSGDAYRHTDHVELAADGQSLSLPVVDYEYQRRRTGGRNKRDISDEHVTLRMTLDQLRQIIDAAEVSGTIAYVQFDLDPGLREAMRVLHRELTGSASSAQTR
jgi:hypothetical protein